MAINTTARMALRAATREEHHRVDTAFSRFSLVDREGYTCFLQAQARALLPLESAISASDPQRILDDWPKRQRAALLRRDLADLGTILDEAPAIGSFQNSPEILGTVYVLEGSRLGGVVLQRSLPPGFPRRFLSSCDPVLWRTFITLIDNALTGEDDRMLAVNAAKSAFVRFEQSARSFQR